VLGYLIRRVLWAIVLLFAISVCTFVIFYVIPGPGIRVGQGFGENSFSFGSALQLHGPLPEQYAQFVWHILHGSLGYSYFREEPVTHVLLRGAPVTASLVIGGLIVSLLIAIPVGILAATRPRSVFDKATVAVVLIGVSAHPIWLSLMLSYFLGYRAQIFPIGGGYCDAIHPDGLCGGVFEWGYHLILPWFVFAALFAAMYTRMIRASVMEALDDDYVRVARAKGATEWRVMRSHVIRNAMLPVVTLLGMDVSIQLVNSAYIESIFALPGLGRTWLQSFPRRDLPVIMGIALYFSVAAILVNLIVDLLYAWIDPRIGLSYRRAARGEIAHTGAQAPAPAAPVPSP
jgi:peptide/nickel transport system permease protein